MEQAEGAKEQSEGNERREIPSEKVESVLERNDNIEPTASKADSAEPSTEHIEHPATSTRNSEQLESTSKPPTCSSEQLEPSQSTVCVSEQEGQSTESPECSEPVTCAVEQVKANSEQSKQSEPMVCSSETVECPSEQGPSVEQAVVSEQVPSVEQAASKPEQSKQLEPSTRSFEQVALRSALIVSDPGSESISGTSEPQAGFSEQVSPSSEASSCSVAVECSEQAASEPSKDAEAVEEWSETWLEQFSEHLSRAPQLWRASHMLGKTCKPKGLLQSLRGVKYLRLLGAIDPAATGEPEDRLRRAIVLCRDFISKLKSKMQQAAVRSVDSSPAEALARCPAWVRRADSYLKLMPGVFNRVKGTLSKRKKYRKQPVEAPSPALEPAPSPEPGADARLLRRVVRGMRRALHTHRGHVSSAAATVATSLGEPQERVLTLWLGMCKRTLRRLRALIACGDVPTDARRLDAADWAVADLLLIYDVQLVHEESYQNYEQLSALLGTFHLVQRFNLEQAGKSVPPTKWREAADWYSRDRVQMSAVGLQRRWTELKLDTRRRFLRAEPQHKPAPLPLHQAIARRYEHVIQESHYQGTWPRLVANHRIAKPTSERGPAPGEPDVPKDRDDDDTSDDDTGAVDNDDSDNDVTIVEKNLETIDLSEDKNEEEPEVIKDKKKKKKRSSPADNHTANGTSSKDQVTTSENNKNVTQFVVVSYKKIDKALDVNKEIVDLDAPSPESNVLEAFQELDASNIETTIEFESDEEDVIAVENTGEAINVGSDTTKDGVAGENESHRKKIEKYRRESSDSEDGNLVIDCGENEKSGNSEKCDESYTDKAVWKATEAEMLFDPMMVKDEISEDQKPHESNEKEDSKNDETSKKFPLLTSLLKTYEDFLVPDSERNKKVYYNTKRFHAGENPKQYGKQKVKISHCTDSLFSIKRSAKIAEYKKNIASEVGGEAAAEDSTDSGREKAEEESAIDPKLLMYAVVLLERIDESALFRLRSPSPLLRPRDSPQISRQSSRCPLLRQLPSRDSSEISRQSPSPLLRQLPSRDSPQISRQSPSPLLRQLPSRDSPKTSRQSSPSPLLRRLPSKHSPPRSRPPPKPTPLSPPNTSIPRAHPRSLFHYFAATLSPKVVFLKHNVPLLKKCKPCSVVLKKLDMTERGSGSRVAKRVELPDIEEVRRNNRSMLTAQVAPLASRRNYVSSPEPPSCSSDSDWTPDAAEGPALAEATESTESNAATEATESETPGSLESDEETGSAGHPAGLPRVLNDALAGSDEGQCDHDNPTSVCGPGARMFMDSCSACAARLLSAPPGSDEEASLQRRLLRRLARPVKHTTTAANPTITTATTTANSSGNKSKASKSKKSNKRPRSHACPPSPAATPVELDAEAAAREWLRQKNIAAEKFGVKPRSFKKPAPAPPPREPPATLQPLAVAAPQDHLVHKPAHSQSNQNMENYRIVMRQGDASVLPVTEENVSRHSTQSTFRVAAMPTLLNKSTVLTSTTLNNPGIHQSITPTILNQAGTLIVNQTNTVSILHNQNNSTPPLFNPDAVADINKKLTNIVSLAPESDGFSFHPLITNVQSLAPKTTQKKADKPSELPSITLKKAEPVYASYLTNTSKQNIEQQFIIISTKNPNQAVSRNAVLSSQEQNDQNSMFAEPNLPQVVNVSGGLQLDDTGVGRGLHLIVSQQQDTNASALTNMLNQSNIVVNNQSIVVGDQQTNIVSNIVNQSNIVVNGNFIQSVQNQQVNVQPCLQTNSFLVTSMPQSVQSQPLLVSCPSLVTSQPSVLFSSMRGRTAQGTPLVVRSVQAGPATGTAVTGTAGHGTAGPGTPRTGTAGTGAAATGTTATSTAASGTNVISLLKKPPWVTEDDGEKTAPEMAAHLDWSAPPLRAQVWARGRDSTALRLLCSGPRGAAGWLLAGRYYLVSEEEQPPKDAAYWSLRPRHRLLMPGEEETSEPASKRQKVDPPEPSTPKPTWLKVRSFARMTDDSAEAPAQKEPEEKSPKKAFSAPPRVFVNSLVYQKLSDDDLLYAKLVVTVANARACRALLSRGAALQLYCLRSGALFPLQTEPKEDVSRITLSGDEEVAEALVALAAQLYRLPEPGASTAQEPRVTEKQDRALNPRTEKQVSEQVGKQAGKHVGEQAVEPAGKRPKQLVDTLASKRAKKSQPPQPPLRPPAPSDVIELSDEDE